ncbi:MAG: restriction endonuclease [Acidobacteriota bacterium]
MEHSFTGKLKDILASHFGEASASVYENSQLLQYLNLKTKSADRGSKARGSFANLYAIYVLVEDYIENGFVEKESYAKYVGAEFSRLFARQRQLPFGSKLQNHALNNRMNAEFQKFFPTNEFIPILRNLETNRYWINENLLKVMVGENTFNISQAIIKIIDEYVKTKQDAFQKFIRVCEDLQTVENSSSEDVEKFILSLLAPNVDARLFEIVSYAILKFYYHDQKIFWGFELENLNKENLKLYKTGRTNANDGGIDFVMKPLGRFFQVTETLDFKKYFLDIDKIEKYPITFVIKSVESVEDLHQKLKVNALKSYSVEAVVENYLSCIEELINISVLTERFREAVKQGYLISILNEIVTQSKVEFNYQENEK